MIYLAEVHFIVRSVAYCFLLPAFEVHHVLSRVSRACCGSPDSKILKLKNKETLETVGV
jgi:hypothetical protein